MVDNFTGKQHRIRHNNDIYITSEMALVLYEIKYLDVINKNTYTYILYEIKYLDVINKTTYTHTVWDKISWCNWQEHIHTYCMR